MAVDSRKAALFFVVVWFCIRLCLACYARDATRQLVAILDGAHLAARLSKRQFERKLLSTALIAATCESPARPAGRQAPPPPSLPASVIANLRFFVNLAVVAA